MRNSRLPKQPNDKAMTAQSDVLIIGGGMSAWAAIVAAKAGASAILAEKGYVGTSGVTATGGPTTDDSARPDLAGGGVREETSPSAWAIRFGWSVSAHLYFVSIHPFEGGNGRVARALAEKAMSQAIGGGHRLQGRAVGEASFARCHG